MANNHISPELSVRGQYEQNCKIRYLSVKLVLGNRNHMTRNTNIIQLAGRLVAGLTLFCGLSSAASIVVTGVDYNRGGGVQMNADGQDIQAYFAGVIFISLTSPDGTVYNRDSVCVDLFTDIYIGSTYGSTVLTPSDVPGKNLTRVSWLLENALLPTQQAVDPNNPPAIPQADWATNAAQGTGLQLAIWDIVHDGGDGFSSGRVQAASNPANPTDPTVLGWAQFYESASAGQSDNNAYIYNNVDMGNGQPAQMLAGPRFVDGGPTPPFQTESTPEPASFLLSGIALVGLGKGFRKQSGKQ